ncbi:hypothetical protein RclHR1_07480012 [Rhizophagus clarus]|uniref:Uncharacterized protein n=1 Tax=Rhizophagus clarus TaxID=94130 RepID=A0A2Z6SD46_9GLOM|nr:hypothetical protein RclHR1_07480012 [Rhizophagus clarus]
MLISVLHSDPARTLRSIPTQEDVLDHGLPSSNTNTSLIKQFLIEHDSSLIPILINLAENFSFYKVLHFYTDVPLSL